MKDNTQISTLARPNTKAGMIRFVHSDGKEHKFYTCINDLSGSRLTAFDDNAPSVNDSVAWIKSVFRDIRRKSSRVIDSIGDF